jgi:serine/threonine protein kinase, bacterial
VLSIITAVASALDYAHKQGLLHRDVKPANIMLTHLDDDGDQRILLADFGIARNVDDISGLTTTNMTVGTVAYSAPEQLMGEEIDGRADEYALAATAYHLLTGSQLFPHSNPAVVISRHLNSPPPALADILPDLAALDPVFAAALAKNPENRFRRCADFARELTERQDATPRAASPAAPTTPAPAARKRAAKAATDRAPTVSHRISGPRKQWLIPGAALAVIVLVGVIALWWQPWKDGQSETAQPSNLTSPAQRSPPGVPTSSATAPPVPPAPATTTAERVGTDVLTAVAVDERGQPTNGYREGPSANVSLSACSASPAAVSQDIYACDPSAADADVCWPSPPESMFCMSNPWDKELRRLTYDIRTLPTVQPPTTPQPFAITLDNGAHCILTIGGTNARRDGYFRLYTCGPDLGPHPRPDLTAQVLADIGNPDGAINRSLPLWTVTYERPGSETETRTVTTAWFAGN